MEFRTGKIYIFRDVIFNEAELTGNKDVKDPSQGSTAPPTTANDASTTPATIEATDKESIYHTKNIEESPITGRTRKTTYKIELSKKVFQKAVGVTDSYETCKYDYFNPKF
jgi:hypothetical protein